MIIFRIAKQAVIFDEKKEYGKALTLYSVCSTLLTSEINVMEKVFLNARHGILAAAMMSSCTLFDCVLCTIIVWTRSTRLRCTHILQDAL